MSLLDSRSFLALVLLSPSAHPCLFSLLLYSLAAIFFFSHQPNLLLWREQAVPIILNLIEHTVGTCCSQGIFSDGALEKGDSQQWVKAEIEQQPLPGSWQQQAFQGESRGGRWEDSKPPAFADVLGLLYTILQVGERERQILLLVSSKVLTTVATLCFNCRTEKWERKQIHIVYIEINTSKNIYAFASRISG